MSSEKPKNRNILWPLRVLVVASLIVPALFFAYSGWENYQRLEERTEERIGSALDVVQEHTLKAFQTVERTIAETNEILRDLSPEQIRADERRLQARLRKTQDSLPQIEAIWAFDRDGRPLVSSTIFPVPPDLNNSDRDYFAAHVNGDAGTFIGKIITAKIGGFQFFVVSQRRPSPDGAFNGVIAISVRPEHFQSFYFRVAQGFADSLGMIRTDGEFLARYPARGPDAPMQLSSSSSFMRAIQHSPEAGRFSAISQIDGIERRMGYRKVQNYPIYVQVGIEENKIWDELWDSLRGLFAFGVPTALALFLVSVYALRRTRHFYAEVSRREKAEAALKQAQRLEAIGHLTGGVAHDFNNLLMVVKGNVDRLKRFPFDDRQMRSLDAIDHAATRGASLVRQLLSFSRQQTHEATVVNLGEYLTSLEDILRSSLRGDIILDMRVPDLWNTKVDLNELELAILNIAVNARDAMPEGGRLTIQAWNATLFDPDLIGLQGDFVALSLTDTGLGIPEDVLPHVFEPFYTTKEVGKGTGLGLSQVYGFARQSGGTATILAEVGRGTTVTLYLPRSQEIPAGDAASHSRPQDAKGQGHILLVEDNRDIADVTRTNLEELGFHVTHAATVQAALNLLRQGMFFDLVFSDIVMPGEMNGVDLARVVRERYPSLPILLTTGYSNMAQTAMDEGLSILRKPYEMGELVESIERTLRMTSLKATA
ncbi:hybrid sensor histidine kinase/response regulator [Microvirga solisilvae]|uniref:hybrid sensor histidine kinase/response regulator n=1 Tax=Microvirga solisilvae TaxID=2919498 RepID=UPI001FAF7DBA